MRPVCSQHALPLYPRLTAVLTAVLPAAAALLQQLHKRLLTLGLGAPTWEASRQPAEPASHLAALQSPGRRQEPDANTQNMQTGTPTRMLVAAAVLTAPHPTHPPRHSGCNTQTHYWAATRC
jgi:hypothetical protein